MTQWFEQLDAEDHEQVMLCSDPRVGYRGVIAIHSTALGPAVGGTRYWRYETERAVVRDALRLSRGMTYKNALAGLPLGGGKSIIWDRGGDRIGMLRAHARFIDRLGGAYITAEDIGTRPADMDIMREVTPHVAGASSGLGDPSPYTARGVLRALEACAAFRWGDEALAGRAVVIQGVGGVGSGLARLLSEAGAILIIADTDSARAQALGAELGARVVEPPAVYDVEADVFAPCAFGGILNDETIPRLRASVVVGGANNQLLEPRHAAMLAGRGILYGPDYVANAGGVISGSVDILGWPLLRAQLRIDAIYDTMSEVLQLSADTGLTPASAADLLAEEKLRV